MNATDSYPLGIDLGTTFSVVAYLDPSGRPTTVPNAEGDLTTPSVVFFDEDNIVVGKEAVRAAALDPERVADHAKRDMGSSYYTREVAGQRFPPEVIQSLVLEKVKRDAELRLGPIQRAVVTVPAFFNEPRRKATQDAGRLAGLEVLDIINEPTAAAIAHAYQHQLLGSGGERNERILVYDLGGGTFDVTLMEVRGRRFSAIATGGDVYLGGIDWDRRIVDYAAQEFVATHGSVDPRQHLGASQKLFQEAEVIKRALSARTKAQLNFDHEGRSLRMTITRDQFEGWTADLLERTRLTCRSLIREVGLQWKDIQRVLLVGGSTRMPSVTSMLEQETGIVPDRSLAADEAVAHGAAIYAGVLTGQLGAGQSIEIQNVNSHSLGVLGKERSTGRTRNSVLIPRNSPLPASAVSRFTLLRDGQRSVLVEVIEGGDASGNHSTPIGRCSLRDLPEGLPAGTSIEVGFYYEANGRLAVNASIPSLARSTRLTVERKSGLSDVQLQEWDRRLRRQVELDS